MAASPPSVQSLQSWEDAFIHYPLPTVRALERDLRKNIEENRSKLRSLVGASYRDLLGTAERIVEMDGQMTTLERGLGDMGRRCDARTSERAGSNWAGMKKHRSSADNDHLATMARMKVLQGCLTVVSRVVRSKGDALLGAKVLVLARLLAKSSGDSPPVLEPLRKRLAVIRKKLLAYIERSMTSAAADKAALAGTLCAYALVTSSTPKEVLRHFLQVRFRQLESKADSPTQSEVMEMLDLYSQTLLDTKDLFPRRFAEALSQLAKAPLFRDPQVCECNELSLDIYGQWIAEDVRSFTPWVRHDQVTSSEVNDALASWTEQAHECLVAGMEEYLERQTDLQAVIASRHAVVLKFMALSSRLRSDTHVRAIDTIRDTFLQRIKALVISSAELSNLRFDGVVSSAQSVNRRENLWDLARSKMDLSQGAHAFRLSIVRHRNGRDTAIDEEISKLDSWSSQVEGSMRSIEHMRTQRWDDDLDFDIDDLHDGDALQQTLSKQDPKDLMESLSKAVEDCFSRNAAELEKSGEKTNSPAYLLRLWRELDLRVRSLQSRLTFSPAKISLQAVHRNLALSVAQDAIKLYRESIESPSHVATTLWDETPPLPVQPAPATLKFMMALHCAMSAAGDDLWSAECVAKLRDVVDEKLGDMLFSPADDDSGLTNGHGADGGEDGPMAQTPNNDFLLQVLFDATYLQQVFHSSGSSGLANTIAAMHKRASLDQASQQRLEKSAKDYWKRTYLLFGLLANRV